MKQSNFALDLPGRSAFAAVPCSLRRDAPRPAGQRGRCGTSNATARAWTDVL